MYMYYGRITHRKSGNALHAYRTCNTYIPAVCRCGHTPPTHASHCAVHPLGSGPGAIQAEISNITCTYTVFSRVSAHLRVSTHPRFLLILWSVVHVYMRYTYKWLLRVNTHPRFFAREFKLPQGAYTGDYGTHYRHLICVCVYM